MKRPRITDIDVKPPRLIDSADIAGDVERFLAAGGAIERPAFRRDFCEPGGKGQENRDNRRWVTPPPGIEEFSKRGGKRK